MILSESDPTELTRVTAEEVLERQARGEPLVLLDNRSAADYDKSSETIPGSLRIPVDEVQLRVADLPRDRAIITWCT